MYQALYRKWRPKTFDQVVGQEHITETLKNQIITGKLSHAYLFIGTRGTGKTTCAKILAKALNCEHPENGNPCGKCPACLGIEEGSILDVVEIDAASNNSVENVRALREEAVFSPVSVKKRVYIIDEVHMLSMSAFNALLKILEEPPEHLTFILATTELNKVPATILSRCQRHSFKRLTPDLIANHLQYIAAQESLDLEPDAAKLIAGLAEGGMRDALSLLDQCSGASHIDVESVYSSMGLTGNRRISLLMDNVSRRKTQEALNLFNELWCDGKDPITLLGEINTLQRDCLMLLISPAAKTNLLSGGYTTDLLNALNKRLTKAELIRRIDTVSDYLARAKDAPNAKLLAEMCIISLCDPALTEDTSALRARISLLESKLEGIESGAVAVGSAVKTSHEEDIPDEDIPGDEDLSEEAEDDFAEMPDDIFDDIYPRADSPVRTEFDEDDFVGDDEIDPAQFTEYQPEDDLLDKKKPSEVKTEESPADLNPDAPPQAASAPTDSGELWKLIAEELEDSCSRLIAAFIGMPSKVRGEVGYSSLEISAISGVPYNSLNKSNVIMQIREAAFKITGRQLKVNLHEVSAFEDAPTHSLEELKQFKETKLV